MLQWIISSRDNQVFKRIYHLGVGDLAMQHVLQMRNPGADCHNYHSLFPVHHHGQAQGEGIYWTFHG